ncbi:MAG: Ppx/GppA phosphatase family protein [Caulobacteraceae bacterium]
MWARADKGAAHDAAVIDVGSNSIRLVLYRVEGRSIWTVYNEKVLAGLGRDLIHTGRLSVEGSAAALAALKRFRVVLDALKPATIHAVATAAVRDAEDGPAFVKQIKAETGFTVQVLSGEEEARYSALGVVAGIPGADGVAGDLGGFSLELVRLKGGSVGKGVTLPLGPFALETDGPFDAGKVREEADRRLEKAPKDLSGAALYAVGGAWRNLALIHMRMVDYPLKIVHQYEMPAQSVLATSRFLARQSRGSLERIPGLSKKRLDSIPYAAVALEALVERLNLSRVITCAWGLREGILFEAMRPEVRETDPLIHGSAWLGGRGEQSESLGAALQAWAEPMLNALSALFPQGRDAALTAAACRLADLGSRLHPDHRADLVFQQVLRAPIAGMDHEERAFLAVACHARHSAQAVTVEPETIGRLLSAERLLRARVVGATIRLGCDLSARTPELLGKSRLRLSGDTLRLDSLDGGANLLLGEQTTRRAAAVAAMLGRKLEVRAAG